MFSSKKKNNDSDSSNVLQLKIKRRKIKSFSLKNMKFYDEIAIATIDKIANVFESRNEFIVVNIAAQTLNQIIANEKISVVDKNKNSIIVIDESIFAFEIILNNDAFNVDQSSSKYKTAHATFFYFNMFTFNII